ncbi:hypothetical protein [Methanosarcina sp. 1.H.T.1A.1]|uniref:hypothetical protein n=1 Tax=Methanosarcina sp. 1.H.T.1A.1 TaxID=1483602 RepID=UPI0012E08F6D|nr:hypothetical protein [Methanosarcina sp. 1.H.T.1A.1]
MGKHNYTPLITKAKSQFLKVFDENAKIDNALNFGMDYDSLRYMGYRRRMSFSYEKENNLPLKGEIFYSPDRESLLYIVIYEKVANQSSLFDFPSESTDLKNNKENKLKIEVGYIGDKEKIEHLNHFIGVLSEALHISDVEWTRCQTINPKFLELSKEENNKFVSADTVTEEEIRLATILENQAIRDITITIRQSGAILESDLNKKKIAKPEEITEHIHRLVESELINEEYVIICRDTSNQINRVNSLDVVNKMIEVGVKCSCGKLISEERYEKLFTPNIVLRKMLDQSYWTTVKLVDNLRKLGISNNQILLNLRDGAEEIDAFVDVDGALCMFELKDNEFSMGHAYAFSSRIDLYKPNYAVIVSTKSISKDVILHFDKVKPKSKIVYISNLKDIVPSLNEVVSQVSSKKASRILEMYTWAGSISVPINIVSSNIGLKIEKDEHDSDYSF